MRFRTSGDALSGPEQSEGAWGIFYFRSQNGDFPVQVAPRGREGERPAERQVDDQVVLGELFMKNDTF